MLESDASQWLEHLQALSDTMNPQVDEAEVDVI